MDARLNITYRCGMDIGETDIEHEIVLSIVDYRRARHPL